MNVLRNTITIKNRHLELDHCLDKQTCIYYIPYSPVLDIVAVLTLTNMEKLIYHLLTNFTLS